MIRPLLAAVLLATAACAPAPVRSTWDPAAAEARLRDSVSFLASDDLEGRCAGQPGSEKAAEWIVARLQAAGLEPAGVPGPDGKPTWFQPFTFDHDGASYSARNVVGRVAGSDPALAGEAVVLGAHYDHVGRLGQPDAGRTRNPGGDPADQIWNGADDNASGTATVLEAARSLAARASRPRRPVLVILFSGEEFKLLGSRHYVRHPLVPLEKTAAMINLDMVGRNPESPLDIGSVSTAAEWPSLVTAAAAEAGVAVKQSPSITFGSDHYSFAEKSVPAVHLFAGFHADYHKQTDHPERLAYPRMAKVARFTELLAAGAADWAARPVYKGGAAGYKRKLSVSSSKLDGAKADALGLGPELGGLVITAVDEEGVGARAGLKAGDVLVQLGSVAFPRKEPLQGLLDGLNAAKDGADCPLVVYRDGKRLELVAKFPAK